MIRTLPYQENSARWFECLHHLPYPIWLDSGYPKALTGRFDIVSANPSCFWHSVGKYTQIIENNSYRLSKEDPIELLKHGLKQYQRPRQQAYDLPFLGGLMGFFGYELSHQLEPIGAKPVGRLSEFRFPTLAMGFYPFAIVTDHQRKASFFVCIDESLAHLEMFNTLKNLKNQNKTRHDSHKKYTIGPWSCDMSEAYYYQALERINRYIHQGDCYQVNFTQRFQAAFSGSSYVAYQKLRDACPVSYAGYFELGGNTALLSISPEQFIGVHDNLVTTCPIKGTIARGHNLTSDQAAIYQLKNSGKDQAENVMIVDLMRNDLSRVCQLGSVKVESLYQVMTLPNVHHLVSKISGTLKPNYHALDVIRAAFPGGSITGAPKVRAMQIINELEPHKRHGYCGSLGYIDIHGQMDTNIAIRTLMTQDHRIYGYAGGGIVADSDPADEYQECWAKINVLLRTLTDNGSVGG